MTATISTTSLPRRSVPDPTPAGSPPAPPPPAPAPEPRRPRRAAPAAAATRAGAQVEPDPELLLELGRLFWTSALEEPDGVEAAAARVVTKLRTAKRLGELATLLGVE